MLDAGYPDYNRFLTFRDPACGSDFLSRMGTVIMSQRGGGVAHSRPWRGLWPAATPPPAPNCPW